MTLPPEPYYHSEDPYVPTQDEKTMALIAHFGSLVGQFIPALVVFFVKKDSPWVRKECAKVLNFMITFMVIGIPIIFGSMAFIIVESIQKPNDTLSPIFSLIVFPLIMLLNLGFYGLVILNGVRCSNNVTTKYYVSIPFIRPKG